MDIFPLCWLRLESEYEREACSLKKSCDESSGKFCIDLPQYLFFKCPSLPTERPIIIKMVCWNQKVHDWDSWNITLLPHHQSMRRMSMSWSCTLQPSCLMLSLKTVSINLNTKESRSFAHELSWIQSPFLYTIASHLASCNSWILKFGNN